MQYDFSTIEAKWQAHWDAQRTFATVGPGDDGFDAAKPKFYILDMFPYPSGVGLHVGHPLGYIATDIVARYKRMTGFNVLHPMGYDAFGLPAELFAIENGVHPRTSTAANIANMTRQLRQLGLSYDWDRTLATTDVDYYRWTQWIFLQLHGSWFDPQQARIRPIDELVTRLASGEIDVGPDGELIAVSMAGGMDTLGGPTIGARKWHELTSPEQWRVLDQYRLAFMDEVPVNWCPALGTVLSNEEVTAEGRSERGNHPVVKRPLKQWLMRITAMADRLIEDLEFVDWPDSIKQMQRNWIGRSEGARVDFLVEGSDDSIPVFTTRPDTLFGATYMVLAPEHPLVDLLTTDEQRSAVDTYRGQAQRRSDVDRMADTKTKTGVFTGAYALSPVNEARLPIWIADYVLMGYGTGAIMAVPAHDQRDFEFAKAFDLPIIAVVMPPEDWLAEHDLDAEAYSADPATLDDAFTGQGLSIQSAYADLSIDQLETPAAQQRMTDWLVSMDLGRPQVQYKLRDWVFSRQHYWGEPFPIVHTPDGQIKALDASDLPIELPEMEQFAPEVSDDPDAPPLPPLSRAPRSWGVVEVDGANCERETNTMPQWAGSCWYFLRFLDPHNAQRFVDAEKERYWMAPTPSNPSGGVDLYIGGVEHAVLHLLYARFWHKSLYDLGHVSTAEPIGRLFNQGYVQAYCYRDQRGIVVPAEEVVNAEGRSASQVQGEPGEKFFHAGEPVTEEYGKMGKSLKNAVAPDDICDQYGCDTLRLYEMAMGPLGASRPWATRDIIGVHRFLQRLWRNFIDQDGSTKVADEPPPTDLLRLLHRTIKRVTDDMQRMSFHTAIAALIELNNDLVQRSTLPRQVAETLALLLAPLAPHMAEELWQRLGHDDSLAFTAWPQYDSALLVEAEVEYPVSINGKLRGRITVAADADDAVIEAAAMADEKVEATLVGKTVRKVIIVKGKMVNIVVG
jgi:leucyl-tRNA synthetase